MTEKYKFRIEHHTDIDIDDIIKRLEIKIKN